MSNSRIIELNASFQMLKNELKVQESDLAPNSELQDFKSRLRHFFLNETSNLNYETETGHSILTALDDLAEIKSRYPVLYIKSEDRFSEFFSFISSTADTVFEGDELKLVHEYIDEFLSDPETDLDSKNSKDLFQLLVDNLKIRNENDQDFHIKCDKLLNLLDKGDIIEHRVTKRFPFDILKLNLKSKANRLDSFIKRIRLCITGLSDILRVHGIGSKEQEDTYDFAKGMISFEKVSDIEAGSKSSTLSSERLNAIKECVKELDIALKSYKDQTSFIFVSEEIVSDFKLNDVFNDDFPIDISEGPSTSAIIKMEVELDNFIRVMASLKLAELEISQQYESDLHDAYFKNFNRSYLSDEDLLNLRPIIVIETAANLLGSSQELMALISAQAPVKVLSVNKLDKIIQSNLNEVQDSHLEIAALALIRRSSFIFQGSYDTPQMLHGSIGQGLNDSIPALWNILLPGTEMGNAQDLISLSAAIESRYFPRLVYNFRSGLEFGSHFDITMNSLADQDYSSLHIDALSETGNEEFTIELTPADFYATLPGWNKKLKLIPANYADESVVPLSEYIKMDSSSISDKLPFVWALEKNSKMVKALVPLSWVQKCRERLSYWEFLQELGGTDNYHVRKQLESEKAKWEIQKKDEIDAIQSRMRKEFEERRDMDLEMAIKRMLNNLLDNENGLEILEPDQEEGKEIQRDIQKAEVIHNDQTESKPLENNNAPEISSEVWVESDECTSCNDCIDALPGVFKYNDDKQAFVHNPTGGSYAKIVAAAEKCPARCIHPGLPHNQDEPHLEKLVARAEKFN